MTCKDCYHCPACCGHDEEKANREYPSAEKCRDFKDKSRIIESRDKRESYLFRKIHEREAEIERLQSVNADMQESLRLAAEANKDMRAEIERLRDNKIIVPSRCQGKTLFLLKRVNAVRAEAIKEFAERLKRTPFRGLIDGGIGFVIHKDIDNLVKEMVGDSE